MQVLAGLGAGKVLEDFPLIDNKNEDHKKEEPTNEKITNKKLKLNAR